MNRQERLRQAEADWGEAQARLRHTGWPTHLLRAFCWHPSGATFDVEGLPGFHGADRYCTRCGRLFGGRQKYDYS